MNDARADLPIDLLTPAQMGEADRAAIAAGISGLELMENAGRATAEAASKLAGPGARVLVACGPGNNGGDGFVAARHLQAAGYEVTVALLGRPDHLKGDAAAMAARWSGALIPLEAAQPEAADVVVDALFGAGLSRPLDGVASTFVQAVNSLPVRVVSVDVPSGLDGGAGNAAGPVVEADTTVTFFRLKPGHLLLPGRVLCGDVVLADIGIPARVIEAIAPMTFRNSPALWRGACPVPGAGGHKYGRGHAVVVSGGHESTGAARLGARGALRAGAGLVTVAGPPAATMVNAAHLTAIMVKSFGGRTGLTEILSDKRKNAVLIGPGAGVGAETAQLVLAVLASEAAAVLDADALTSFAAPEARGQTGGSDPNLAASESGGGIGFLRRATDASDRPADLFAAIAGRSGAVVLTPHTGEFAQLFADVTGRGSKLDQAREAAKASGAVVILKGADTVIAAPDGRAAINDNAPPWLATAGSGDVLAGIATGLLAQHMPVFEAACAAVWLHGAAATAFGPGLIAEDLPEALPKVIAALI